MIFSRKSYNLIILVDIRCLHMVAFKATHPNQVLPFSKAESKYKAIKVLC